MALECYILFYKIVADNSIYMNGRRWLLFIASVRLQKAKLSHVPGCCAFCSILSLSMLAFGQLTLFASSPFFL